MVADNIAVPRREIEAFCRRHHIRRLSLFGSVLGEEFRADSDIDVLVEFDPVHVPGFLRLDEIERQLSDILGHHRIDLVTPGFLNRRLRDRILREAEVVYDRR